MQNKGRRLVCVLRIMGFFGSVPAFSYCSLLYRAVKLSGNESGLLNCARTVSIWFVWDVTKKMSSLLGVFYFNILTLMWYTSTNFDHVAWRAASLFNLVEGTVIETVFECPKTAPHDRFHLLLSQRRTCTSARYAYKKFGRLLSPFCFDMTLHVRHLKKS